MCPGYYIYGLHFNKDWFCAASTTHQHTVERVNGNRSDSVISFGSNKELNYINTINLVLSNGSCFCLPVLSVWGCRIKIKNISCLAMTGLNMLLLLDLVIMLILVCMLNHWLDFLLLAVLLTNFLTICLWVSAKFLYCCLAKLLQQIPHTGDINSLDRCGQQDRYKYEEVA